MKNSDLDEDVLTYIRNNQHIHPTEADIFHHFIDTSAEILKHSITHLRKSKQVSVINMETYAYFTPNEN